MPNETTPAVSVIIPMYNTEKYIGECLQSLLNQTLKNFEVIVVDDCSTDKSLEVAEKMVPDFESKKLKLSTVTLTQNSGCPGIPRNIAMEFAKGKYIYFLDSDDFLDKTALEDFYKVAEKFQADVVHAEKYFEYRENEGENLFSTQVGEFVNKPKFDTSDIVKRTTNFVEKKYLWSCCNKLFRRKFLIKNKIKFPETTISDDLIFAFMCVVCAKNYVRVPFVNYHYRIHEGALSQSPFTTESISLNLMEGVYFLDSFMRRQKFFIKNPNCMYAVIDFFNQSFLDVISESLFGTQETAPGEVYALYCEEIFSLDPPKTVPLSAYLFISMNIFKMFVTSFPP